MLLSSSRLFTKLVTIAILANFILSDSYYDKFSGFTSTQLDMVNAKYIGELYNTTNGNYKQFQTDLRELYFANKQLIEEKYYINFIEDDNIYLLINSCQYSLNSCKKITDVALLNDEPQI